MKQRLKSITMAGVLSIAAVICFSSSARADWTCTINPAWGVQWQGWGCSLAWWANIWGGYGPCANVCWGSPTNYTAWTGYNPSVPLVNLPNLGLNIVRYNLGACSGTPANGQQESIVNIPWWKQMAGYWTNGNSTDVYSSSWTWNVDQNQQAAMYAARSLGANYFELFANSPMWWMCNNNNPAGGANGASNLRSGYQDYHAIYLASIAWAFKNWAPALTFNSVEAFNEPSSGYWNSQGSQEGCDFDRPTMSTVMTDLRQELNNRGMGSTIVAGADETSYIEAAQTLEQIGSVTMSRVNVHGYETSDAGTDRTRLYNDAVARGLPIWNTEYGEGDTTGLSLIANLNRDFQYLHMSAWCYWLPFDGSGWGLINADNGNWVLGNANTKYFVLAHYTRHIRPGDYILATSSPDVVSAYDNTNHKLIIVCCNWATSGLNITFNLSQYNNVSGPISRWTTLCHGGANYVPDGGFSGPSGKSFTAYFMPSAISTFEINNVW